MKRFVIAFLLIFLGIVFRPVLVRADRIHRTSGKNSRVQEMARYTWASRIPLLDAPRRTASTTSIICW